MSKKPSKKESPKFNLYQVVTDRIIASLKAGVIPWEKPWKASQFTGGPLLDNGYGELPIGSEHAVAIEGLPLLHRDPFDRILIAQATVEGIVLLTVDPLVAQYPGPVRRM